jgi:hypothetical protein
MSDEHKYPPFVEPVLAKRVLAEHGVSMTVPTLATKRVRGGGPPFYKDGPRVKYSTPELIEYARQRLSRQLRSTSDSK